MKMSCCSNKWAWLASGLLLMLVHYAMASRYVNVQGGSQKVTECGGYINGTRGFIKTPNFPRRFPTPISCRWLLFAPPSHKLILYFTQYYMRESFQVTVFDYYQDDRHYRGRHELGEISFEDEVTQYTVYKSYLLLEFQVEEIGNIHLRVDDFLLDVYGFNITYEVVPVNEPPRQDACSVYKCSFLGSCMATANFETYKCHCFGPYFGDECQYGPYCDPENGLNMCYNNGKCRSVSFPLPFIPTGTCKQHHRMMFPAFFRALSCVDHVASNTRPCIITGIWRCRQRIPWPVAAQRWFESLFVHTKISDHLPYFLSIGLNETEDRQEGKKYIKNAHILKRQWAASSMKWYRKKFMRQWIIIHMLIRMKILTNYQIR